MLDVLAWLLSDCSMTGRNSFAWTSFTRSMLNVTFLVATPSTWSPSADVAVMTPEMVGIAASACCISGLFIIDIAPAAPEELPPLLLPLLIDENDCIAMLLTSETDVYCHLPPLSSGLLK